MIQNHSVEYPSKITENFAEWALELQPWWGFAGLHDPRASSSKGHWPIRRWFFTFSFQILGIRGFRGDLLHFVFRGSAFFPLFQTAHLRPLRVNRK